MTEGQLKKIQSMRRRVNGARHRGEGIGTTCAIAFHTVAAPVVAFGLGIRDADRDVREALYAPETQTEVALREAEDKVTEERVAERVASRNGKARQTARAAA
jgi:hypothetical protein